MGKKISQEEDLRLSSSAFLSKKYPMTICLLKSKIHRATVTGASLDYEGSLTIAADLAERVGFLPYEKILVGNMANGERFETYVIYGKAGSGVIELNGATALLGKIGDLLTIMSYAWLDVAKEVPHHKPSVILLGKGNVILV
ncbi:MAG: aspartate 1-decarboxylase [Chthoniobacterales bacterium]